MLAMHGATVADVVDYFVGSVEDFAWRAVGIGVPGIRLDYPEHWLTPAKGGRRLPQRAAGYGESS